jgi:hypothetical protein
MNTFTSDSNRCSWNEQFHTEIMETNESGFRRSSPIMMQSMESAADNKSWNSALKDSTSSIQNRTSDNAVSLKKRMLSSDKNKLIKKIDNNPIANRQTSQYLEKSSNMSDLSIPTNSSKSNNSSLEQTKPINDSTSVDNLKTEIIKRKKEIDELILENSRLAKLIAEGQEDIPSSPQKDKVNIQALLDELQKLRAENNKLHEKLMENEGVPTNIVGRVDYNRQIQNLNNEITKKSSVIADLEFQIVELEKEESGCDNNYEINAREIENLKERIIEKKERNAILLKEQTQRLNDFRREMDIFNQTKEKEKKDDGAEYVSQR